MKPKTARRARTPLVTLALLAALWGCDKKVQTASIPHYDLSAASNARFLADFAAKPGTFKTPDGLEYRILKAGTGKAPQSGADMVTVTYRGTLITGKQFDRTPPGRTATFPAGRLIAGWVEALSLMKEGDEWQLAVPSALGYGPDGSGDGTIPGNQVLVFDMKLIKVDPAQ